MRNTVSKALIAGLAALSLTAAVLPANRAAADPPPWAPAWGHRGWHHGHWRGGGWDGWRGPPVVGGLAAGAVVAAPYAYTASCYVIRPLYDYDGNVVGQRLVNVC